MKSLQNNKFKVWLYSKLVQWVTQWQNKINGLTPAPFQLLQLSTAFWSSQALYSATYYKLADLLEDKVLSTNDLAKLSGLNEDYLYRLMRFLASQGVFTEVSTQSFKNSKASQYLRTEHSQTIRSVILMHHSTELTRVWYEGLVLNLKTGAIPFQQLYGMPLFEYMNQNSEFNTLFAQAMDEVEHLTVNQFVLDLDWQRFERIIDVGGSKGAKIIPILEAYPKLKAVVVDRANVIEVAHKQLTTLPSTVAERIQFEVGDILETLPQAQSDNDVYACFAIFHALSDEQSRQLLQVLKRASGSYKAWVVIGDSLVDSINANKAHTGFDMQMLMSTAGRERTLSEWQILIRGSGFELMEVVNTQSFASFLVLRAS